MTLPTNRIEDWNTLHAALGNLKTAANYCQGNIAEFGHITDGEIVDLLDKAIEQASTALALALDRPPVDAELLALRKMVGELEAKLAAPDWYWPAEDTSEDACAFSASEVLDDTPPGKIVVVVRGGIVETMYCAFLPAADDADSDDDFWVEEPTEEAAVLKIAEERVRRAALPTPKEPS